MRITCGSGKYELHIGHFEFESTTNLLDLDNAFRVYQYLIRVSRDTPNTAEGAYLVVATMSIPAAVLRLLYPCRERNEAAGMMLPWAKSMLTPWYYKTPSVACAGCASTPARYRSYLEEMLRDLEDYMFASYLQVVAAAMRRMIILQPGVWQWRQYGVRYNSAGSIFGAGVRQKYVIKPYAAELVTKLALEATERYAIAASLASGNKWVPS